jgi:hypothetical protein
MDESNRAPVIASSAGTSSDSTSYNSPYAAEETINLTTAPGASAGDGVGSGNGDTPPRLVLKTYDPDQQRDYVRLVVTVGLLLMLGGVITWACIESASWKDHWDQTKEMLQIILPALTGLIGSVIGFYFGSGVKNTNVNKLDGDDTGS